MLLFFSSAYRWLIDGLPTAYRQLFSFLNGWLDPVDTPRPNNVVTTSPWRCVPVGDIVGKFQRLSKIYEKKIRFVTCIIIDKFINEFTEHDKGDWLQDTVNCCRDWSNKHEKPFLTCCVPKLWKKKEEYIYCVFFLNTVDSQYWWKVCYKASICKTLVKAKLKQN